MSIPTVFHDLRKGDRFKLKGCFITEDGCVVTVKKSARTVYTSSVMLTPNQEKEIIKLLNLENDNLEKIRVVVFPKKTLVKNLPVDPNMIFEVVKREENSNGFIIKNDSDTYFQLDSKFISELSRFTFVI